MQSKEVDLGVTPVKRLLFVLAVPAITSQVVNALYNMVDRVYIGHIPGEGAAALTGVGICFPIIMIVSAFAYCCCCSMNRCCICLAPAKILLVTPAHTLRFMRWELYSYRRLWDSTRLYRPRVLPRSA